MTGNIVPWRWRKKRVPIGPERDAVTNLQKQINWLFSEVMTNSSRLPDFMSEPIAQLGERLTSFNPNVNVRKTDEAIIVSIELPGMDERDVEISLTSEGLTIRGERKIQVDEVGEDGWSYAESSYGVFERIVPLGDLRVQEERVEATASKGIVTIALPLKPTAEVQARKVNIKSA